MTTTDDLLTYIFDGKQPPLYAEIEDWVRESRRFKAFAVNYRDKIRAKVRNAREDSGRQDLRAELETAMLLLRAEKFTVEYEKYAASKQRGPDFTVTFKTHTPFNVEVRRMRRGELEAGDTEAHLAKLIAVLCEKLGQMPPSILNVLWLTGEREISEVDLARAVSFLRQRTERDEQDFFTRRGFATIAEFNKQYQRMSGIVLHQTRENIVWLNGNARHPIPREIVTTLRRLPQLGIYPPTK